MAPINRPIQVKVDEIQSFENGKASGQKSGQPMSVSPAIGFQERSLTPTRAASVAPVYVNKTHPTDFPWNIEWNAETCIRCGSCVAACTFGAIEPNLRRQGQTISVGNFPSRWQITMLSWQSGRSRIPSRLVVVARCVNGFARRIRSTQC